jgi:predicted acyl esterase
MNAAVRVHCTLRRLSGALAVLAFALVAGCGDSDSNFTSSGGVDLSQAVPATFSAHGSVEQLYVTGADPGADLELVADDRSIVQTGTTDANGTLIFRDVKAGEGYVVVADSGTMLQASQAVTVTAPDDAPPPSFYGQQHIGPGYGYLETRDGTTLAINVILPGPVENGPYPTVVEYSGYDPANPDAPQPGTMIASALGYAAVGINMRGTGCSGGAFQFFETLQSTDGYDAIEAIAAQPWVKGTKVGMVGISYPGISQLFVAQFNPPHLAAITPFSIISDTARGTLYPGGILNNGFAVDWAKDRQHDAMPGGQPWSQKRIDNGDQICIDNQKLRGQTPDILALIYSNQFYNAAIADPISPVTFVHRIKVPVFLAGQWQDEQTGGYFSTMLDRFTGTTKLHFTLQNGGHADSLDPAIFARWTEFLSFYVAEEIPRLPSAAKLVLQVLGQEVFGVPRLTVEPDRFTGAPSFEAALAQFEAEPKVRLLFENGAANPPGAPVPGFERSFDRWPIATLEPTIWYFSADGRLDAAPPTGDGADSYVYDPSTSQDVTLHGSDENKVWLALPPWDWRPLVAGKAVAYATDPLPETVVMAGSASADLWIQSTAKDTDIQVTLSEIRPDGQEVYIQNGWLRASHRKVDDNASTILRPVQTHLQSDAADLPAGKFVQARVEVFPFAHVFRAGSRLRISVGAPGGTRPLWKFDALPADGEVTNTIGRSAAAPSRIVLPVVPGVDVTTPLPPCPGLRGQPCRTFEEFNNTPG